MFGRKEDVDEKSITFVRDTYHIICVFCRYIIYYMLLTTGITSYCVPSSYTEWWNFIYSVTSTYSIWYFPKYAIGY